MRRIGTDITTRSRHSGTQHSLLLPNLFVPDWLILLSQTDSQYSTVCTYIRAGSTCRLVWQTYGQNIHGTLYTELTKTSPITDSIRYGERSKSHQSCFVCQKPTMADILIGFLNIHENYPKIGNVRNNNHNSYYSLTYRRTGGSRDVNRLT